MMLLLNANADLGRPRPRFGVGAGCFIAVFYAISSIEAMGIFFLLTIRGDSVGFKQRKDRMTTMTPKLADALTDRSRERFLGSELFLRWDLSQRISLAII